MDDEQGQRKNEEDRVELPDNPDFAIELNEDITLRRILREGLKSAAEKNKEKIPLLYCRPLWMEEGIVCLWARDLNRFLAEKGENLFEELMSAFDALETFFEKDDKGNRDLP